MFPRILPLAAILTGILALAACSGTPEATEPTPQTSESAQPPAVEPTADAPATPTPGAAPTCDTIITPGTVDALTKAGWTFETRDFVIGDVALPEGLLCLWADFSVASDHGQFYGWSAISADDAAAAQASLLDGGWERTDAPEGIYLSEDPQYAISEDERMTYLFGDGWVKFADTQQSILLVTWQG